MYKVQKKNYLPKYQMTRHVSFGHLGPLPSVPPIQTHLQGARDVICL